MQKRIFYAIFASCLVLGLGLNVAIFIAFKNFLDQQTLQELKKQANTIQSYIHNNLDATKTLDLSTLSTRYRITLVSSTGEVLLDNYANPSQLDNHANRQEIQNALKNGESYAIRYSQSLQQNLIYYAKVIKKDDLIQILRIATPQSNIWDFLKQILPFFVLEIAICLALSALLAKMLSMWILKPIKLVDLEHIKRDSVYKELHSFVKKIKAQNKIIKNTNRHLIQKQEEILSLATNINDGLILLNRRGIVMLANKAAKLYLDNLAESSSILSLFDIQFSKTLFNILQEYKHSNQKDSKSQNFKLKNYECEVSFLPIFAEQKCKGLMVLIQNITEKKLAQNLRKEFSANVTHELKTPLTTILASTEMIKNNMVQNKDVPEFIEKIYIESKRLLVMIDEILKLSFFDENRLDSMPKTFVNLKALVLKVCERLELIASKCEISLELDLQECEIYGVPELLENIIYNLCDNAMKYNKSGGFVKVSLLQTNGGVELRVKDNGIGIPQDSQERVFERFFCVDKGRSKKLGGTGLGLSIVKSACVYHKANLSLKSEVGKGSEFCVKFAL